MIRSDLIRRVAEKRKLDRTKAVLIVTAVLDGIGAALRHGERFEIRGFGTFSARDYPGYAGRNAKTGAPIKVEPKRLPHFKPSKALTVRMNVSPRSAPA